MNRPSLNAAGIVLAFALVASIARGADQPPQVQVLRYLGSGKAGTPHGPRVLLSGVAVVNGRTVQLPLQVANDAKPQDGPKKELQSSVEGLKRGDYIEVTLETDKNGTISVTKIEPYTLKPGEDSPNGFVFHETYDKTEGSKTNHMVKLSKFGQEVLAIIPTHKDDTGALVPDADVTAAAGKLKDGDVAWAQLAPGRMPLVTGLGPWSDPQTGKLVKVETQEEDGQKHDVVQIDKDGTPVTLLVPGSLEGKKWVSDYKVLSAVKRLRPGSQVQYMAFENSGGKLVLHEIEAAKPQAKTASGTGTPAKPAAK